jgi:ABC-type Fe3+ transport system permease subunit/DNA-binding beta-propeller fold protein YncE
LLAVAVTLTAGLPVAWIVASVLGDPRVLVEAVPDRFRLQLLLKTILLAAAAAGVATLLALPAVFALGRGRSRVAAALWFVVPIPLLLPSLVMSYGWSHLLVLLKHHPVPGSPGDLARCVLSLAAWLFPVVAVLGGLALRRLDPAVQEQALLDRGLHRTTLRLLAPALVGAASIVALLSTQEFSVWEPTGISVVATEVRMVFESGAFSSIGNPITAPAGELEPRSDQASRSAAAIAVALPMLAVVGILAAVARRLLRSDLETTAADGAWPRTLDASPFTVAAAWGVLLLTTGLPIAAMLVALGRVPDLLYLAREYQPQLLGSLGHAGLAAAAALGLGLLATVVRPRWSLLVAVGAFLMGGQILAIALVRLYNRRAASLDEWMYDSPAIVVLACLARFGWIALAAGAATHRPAWTSVREQAALDGAGPWRVALAVVGPIAWPLLAAAALIVGVLSLTEVPATVLLAPHTLVPMLMSWVHMLRFEPMIEASLLMVAIVLAASVLIAALAHLATRRLAIAARRARPLGVLALGSILLVGGCSDATAPDAVWGEAGRGPGQFVYPRAIAYDDRSDSFFVADRAGRVQHIDRSGGFLGGWQMPEFARGKPVGLTVGPDGNLWVPDTHYQRVIVFTPAGKIVRQFGREGTAPGEFIFPTDIAFDAAGRVYVAEYGGNDRVQVFTPTGEPIGVIGSSGRDLTQLARPQAILIVGDELFIADSCNHRISVWSLEGRHLRNLGQMGENPGEFRFPYGLDLDRDGMLVVAEFGNNRVQRIDPRDGSPRGMFGTPGRRPGEFVTPWAVAVDRGGRVVTVDGGNNRLQVFRF